MKSRSFASTLFTLTLILLAGMMMRVHGLAQMMDMLHYDEAYYALDALSLIDEPRLTPFFPENYGRESLWMYLLAPALYVSFEGFSPPDDVIFAVRITAIFTGVLTLAAVYRLGRELLGRRAGLWAAAALAVLFWHTLMSHQGYRALLYPLIGALAFAFLFAGRRTDRRAHWLAGGVFLGLLLYTYFAARVWIGLAGVLLAYWFVAQPRQRRGVVLAALTAVVIWLPMLAYLLNNPALASQRLDQVAISSPGQLVDNLALWVRVLVSEGIPDPVYFLKGRPLLDIATGMLLIMGTVAVVVFFSPSPRLRGRGGWGVRGEAAVFLFALIAASLAPAILTTEPLKMLRAFGLVVPLALLMGAGAAWVGHRSPHPKSLSQGERDFKRTPAFFAPSPLGRGVRALLPAALLLWAGVGAWRDFEAWVISPDLYLPMEQHLTQATRLMLETPNLTAAAFYSPFPPGHPVLRVLSAGFGKTKLQPFKGYECLVLDATPDPTDYFSLDMFDPEFAARLSQWAEVEEVLAEPTDSPRWRVYRAQPHADIVGQWGADRIDFGRMSARLLRPLPQAARPGDTLEITLGFRAAPNASLDRSYTAFVHFYGDPSPVEGGAILAQVDAPLCPSYPPPTWYGFEVIVQPLTLTIPPDLAPGRYQLSLGVYDSLTVARLPITYPPGQTDYVLLGSVDITLD